MKKTIAILTTFICLGLCFNQPLAYAQKGKKEKKTEADTVSKYERANAEFLMIDAQKFFLLEDYQRAKAFLEQSIETDPNNHAAYFKLAEINLIEGDEEDGLKSIKKAQEIEPHNKYYYILAAQLNKSKSNLAAAAKEYEAMIANTSDYREYLLDVVDLYVALEDYQAAINMLNLTEEKFHTPNKFFIQKKELLLQSGRKDEALAMLKSLAEDHPKNESYKVEYANLLAATGQKDQAAKVLQSTANAAASASMLIDVKLGQKNFEEAKPLIEELFNNKEASVEEKTRLLQNLVNNHINGFERSFFTSLQQQLDQMYPRNVEVIKTSEVVYSKLLPKAPSEEKKQYQQNVLTALTSLKDLNPSDYEVWDKLLTRAYEQEAWDNLLALGEDALSYFPNQGIFYFYYGAAQLKTQNGDKEEANFAFDQALKLGRNDNMLTAKVKALQTELAIENKEPEKAEKSLTSSFNEEPSNKEVRDALVSYVYFKNSEKVSDGILKTLDNLLNKHPEDHDLIETKARVFFQMGRFADAKQTMESFLKVKKENINGEPIEFYGDILFKLNLVEEAVEQWKKAKELGDTSDKIDQKIADKKYYE